MKNAYLFTLAMCFFLASCNDTEKMRHSAADTLQYVQEMMSGATIEDIKEGGEAIVQDVKDAKVDVENRIEKVSEGLEMIKEGKALVDEGLE